jgi:hypothetical protein
LVVRHVELHHADNVDSLRDKVGDERFGPAQADFFGRVGDELDRSRGSELLGHQDAQHL